MKYPPIALLALCSLLAITTACSRQGAPAPGHAVAPTDSTPPVPADAARRAGAIADGDHAAPARGIDVKGFAGRFGGDDIALELNADGSYTLSGGAVAAPIDGTWTVQDSGKRIRLDPDSEREQDWLLAVDSNDVLQTLDSEGKVPQNAPAGSLRRVK